MMYMLNYVLVDSTLTPCAEQTTALTSAPGVNQAQAWTTRRNQVHPDPCIFFLFVNVSTFQGGIIVTVFEDTETGVGQTRGWSGES